MPRPPLLDRDQVRLMGLTDFPAAVAAARLGCTERHYRRLLDAMSIWTYEDPNPLIGSDDEVLLWRFYRDWGESYRDIAHRFCLSHETIRTALAAAYQADPF